jgi:hypothetical protein
VVTEICRLESRYGTTNIHCLTSQKCDVLNYTAAKAWNLQFYDMLSVLKLLSIRSEVRIMAIRYCVRANLYARSLQKESYNFTEELIIRPVRWLFAFPRFQCETLLFYWGMKLSCFEDSRSKFYSIRVLFFKNINGMVAFLCTKCRCWRRRMV